MLVMKHCLAGLLLIAYTISYVIDRAGVYNFEKNANRFGWYTVGVWYTGWGVVYTVVIPYTVLVHTRYPGI